MNNEHSNHINEFIRHLLSAVTSAALYSLDHPQVKRLADSAHKSLLSALNVSSSISLFVIDNELVLNRKPVSFSLVTERFVYILSEHSISHLRFTAYPEYNETENLISALAKKTDIKTAISSEHIKTGSVDNLEHFSEYTVDGDDAQAEQISALKGIGEAGNEGSLSTPPSLKDISAMEIERLGEIFEAVKRKERIKPAGITETVAELVAAFKREGMALLMLAALREQDEYTFTHSANVCILTLAQAISLGISGQLLHDIGVASMLHDIGKLLIPENILTKPERLNDNEAAIMKRHTILGARCLMESGGLPNIAAIVAFEHHLRFNQTGYPAVSTAWQQTTATQMTAISDCFDAMRTRRVYQEPRHPAVIADVLVKGAGTEFNPILVRNMLQLLARLQKI